MTTDIQTGAVDLYFLPVETRVPLKFGPEMLTRVFCARVAMTVVDGDGRTALGWGETPLSVQWAWPSETSYQERCDTMLEFCRMLARSWAAYDAKGHPLEVGYDYIEEVMPVVLKELNAGRPAGAEQMPLLAALVCCSAFDIALHDAYGNLHEVPVYETYNAQFMNRDLGEFLEAAEGSAVSFAGKYPEDYLVESVPTVLPACHLVGGMDALTAEDLGGSEPDDGYPVMLTEWLERDGLNFLKVKLRGNDAEWDYDRLVKVGQLAEENGVEWLTADFNCMVTDPEYVNEILDKLMREYSRFYQMMLYVEQPFPYEIEENQIDVHSVSARKPLFMDESAHDWKLVRLGRRLGWNGVALKTCKTQSGALLSLCWAKAHGMTLMVQDLTNPMLAQIPHCLLAAHAGTIMGVETNAMQFYPAASAAEEVVHPGLYRRRNGAVDLATIQGSGFGYRVGEINRSLPEKEVLG